MADKIYIELIHWRNIEKIIAIERPDAILPTGWIDSTEYNFRLESA